MKVSKALQFGTVPAGTAMWLTEDQARARAHLLTPVETDRKVKDRALFVADVQVGFKAGEALSLEGDLDRATLQMFGLNSADVDADASTGTGRKTAKPNRAELKKAFDDGKAEGLAEANALAEKAQAEGHKAGRAEMLAEVRARNGLFETLEAAEAMLDALTSESKAGDREKAKAAVDAAQSAVDALEALEA